MPGFSDLLHTQVRNEFEASQQYVAVAVWFDGQDLPQLAAYFYRQSLEERNHAMMLVRYLLDTDARPLIPGIAEVRNEFGTVREPLELALEQERIVTTQIEALAKAARAESNYRAEQFMQWFLKEQIEEVASMKTLLTICDRAGDNLFHLEDYMAREMNARHDDDPTQPPAAGGAA